MNPSKSGMGQEAVSSTDRRKMVLQRLREKYKNNVEVGLDEIKLAMEGDQALEGIFRGFSRITYGSNETSARKTWGKQVEEKTAIINAIDDNDMAKVENHLSDKIKKAIKMNPIDRWLTKYFFGEDVIGDAQKDVNILIELNPEKAENFREKLNAKMKKQNEKTDKTGKKS